MDFGPEGPSWHSDMGVIPALRMLRKEDQEFKASLCYFSRYCSIGSQGGGKDSPCPSPESESL